MLTDTKLNSLVNQLWDKLWTGGLTNPLDAIEQLSYLIFFKRLDDDENARERQAQRRRKPFVARVPNEMRWRTWTQYTAAEALKHVKDKVFPWFKELGNDKAKPAAVAAQNDGAAPDDAAEIENDAPTLNSFATYMQEAEFKINKPNLLIEVCKLIDQMEISGQNQDVQGDVYEHLLSKLNTAGRNGQFRTPRHIIQMMVRMVDPKKHERVGDLAAGTCGFLVNAYQHVLTQNTSPNVLKRDPDGNARGAVGDKLSEADRAFLQANAFRGYDNDSGMTMLRIGSMNLMLHGIAQPRFFYTDTLSKEYNEASDYEVILMNPPFKGAVDKSDVHPDLPSDTTKSELLFMHLILRALDSGGRCAVIVPDGVLFGSSKAHVGLRKKLIEQNRLDGVISMPSGVFKPYAGVSTAVLLFTKGAKTNEIWFYDMSADGFSLDDKRDAIADNDIDDILACWQRRTDAKFRAERAATLAALRQQAAPLKAKRLLLLGDVNCLQFEAAIAPEGDEAAHAALQKDKAVLAKLDAEIAPLQKQIDQLSQQFWVGRAQVAAHKYDLSASRYRQVEQDAEYYEKPEVTLQRLLVLERVIGEEVRELENTHR